MNRKLVRAFLVPFGYVQTDRRMYQQGQRIPVGDVLLEADEDVEEMMVSEGCLEELPKPKTKEEPE